MLKSLKQSFNLTNKYIILATPLILFSLFSSLYILFSINGSVISLVIAVALFFLMLTAFLSGWFFMLKNCVTLPSDNEDVNSLIKDFPAGVGEYFLSVCGLISIIFILASSLLTLAYFAGMKFIGNVGISADALSKALESTPALKAFLMSLSTEQLLKLNEWNLLIFAAMTLTYFLILFYPPALMFKTKNPFKAIALALKDLFSRKFFKNVGIYAFLFITYFALSILTTILGQNIILHFVFTIINFYYLVFAAVLIFDYYYNNFIKIGGNLDERI